VARSPGEVSDRDGRGLVVHTEPHIRLSYRRRLVHPARVSVNGASRHHPSRLQLLVDVRDVLEITVVVIDVDECLG
jgi:hypothetical protein